MAKRRKEKDEDEDKAFKIPKFNEEEFLKKERRHIKAAFIAFIFGVIMAFICFGFWALMGSNESLRWPLVFLVAVVYMLSIKYFFIRLKIDISDFTKGKLVTTYGTYLFTWLLVLMVLVNPPFYDDEAPLIDAAVLPDMQEFGSPVKFVIKITDNAGIEKSGIQLKIDNESINPGDFVFQDNILIYDFPSPTNSSNDIKYDFELIATDINGIQSKYSDSFTYSNDAIKLVSHDDAFVEPGPFVSSGTPINFEVNANVDFVYYTVNDGPRINISKNDDFYTTYPKFEGWLPNQNVTLKVYAEDAHSFKFILPTTNSEVQDYNITIYSNKIVDSQEYYFQVGMENIGVEEPPELQGPPVEYVQVPGFEAIMLIAAIVIVALIYRKKNKDEKKQK